MSARLRPQLTEAGRPGPQLAFIPTTLSSRMICARPAPTDSIVVANRRRYRPSGIVDTLIT